MNDLNEDLFGRNQKIQKTMKMARNISVTKATVLIVGEVGVGKRTLAKYIHNNSSRAEGVLEIIDCLEGPAEVENRILGFRDETGKFNKGGLELANGGTIIFANIEGLEESLQRKLHQILGELDDYDIDVRIIATTTKNLSKLVGSGRFYRGLYTFVSSNTMFLPPIRERSEDLEMMVNYFIDEFNTSSQSNIQLSSEALDKMMSHYWTRNVCELKEVLEKSFQNASDNVLNADDVVIGEKQGLDKMFHDDNEGIWLMSLKEAEKLLIKKALIHTSENRTQAAKILGVSIRTLRNKINEYRKDGSSYFINLR